jgi:hypothetical protein
MSGSCNTHWQRRNKDPKILFVKPEGKRPLGRPLPRLEDNINIDRKEGVSNKIFQTGLLEQELQMMQLSTIRCRCIAIL